MAPSAASKAKPCKQKEVSKKANGSSSSHASNGKKSDVLTQTTESSKSATSALHHNPQISGMATAATYGGVVTNLPSSNAYPRVEGTPSAWDSSRVERNVEEFLGSYMAFKTFDYITDCSDHHFASKGNHSKPRPRNWVKKILEEWRILENNLPETILVRVYETRMDLLRAVIIGAEGTPYHDGLFFFDIYFPASYPNVPPQVHYHARGLRINPNLYTSGKVCLSLLGTWIGNKREKWTPNVSTMLQLLVSIQALILNQKPYFNEPGFEWMKGSWLGESGSRLYSENIFVLSLKNMVYSMRSPPENFEDFVYGHFFSRAPDILKACKAYMEGAPVGSLVKRGRSCSKKFRSDVSSFMEVLVNEFVLLGFKDADKILKSNADDETKDKANAKKHSKWRLRLEKFLFSHLKIFGIYGQK